MGTGTDVLRSRLYERVLETLNSDLTLEDGGLYETIDAELLADPEMRDLPLAEKLKLREMVFASLRRLDILSLATDDSEITEIMVNGPNRIFIEKGGSLELFDEQFSTPEKLSDVIQQIAGSVNRRINVSSPMVDARLPDGSRVNIVLPPIALDGPAVTIRRFPKEPVSMEQLIDWGSITEEAAEFLKIAVRCGYNIFISGGTGAGKTTFLGALAEFIPETERVITIEDSAEFKLRGVRNLVRMETRPANLEGEYEVTIRDLIRNALRMRPDRIIVGEIRGAEALDMLQAMNTGHDGSLTTVHANSPRDVISRLETMVLMGGMDLPVKAIRDQVSAAIDLIVQQARFRDGSRKIVSISEVVGMEGDMITLQDIFVFKAEGVDSSGKIRGRHMATGIHPKVLGKLKDNGILTRDDWFT